MRGGPTRWARGPAGRAVAVAGQDPCNGLPAGALLPVPTYHPMVHPIRRALPSLFLLASLASAQETVRWHGIELDLPAGWSQQTEAAVLLLKPAGWKAGEVTGEAYGLLFDPETTSLEDEDLADTIDAAAEELVTGVARQAEPTAGKLGTRPARSFVYTTKNPQGQAVALTIHVFAAKDGCAALFVLGLTDKLATRDKELTALLGSLRQEGEKPKRRAFGMGGKKEDVGTVRKEPVEPAGGADDPAASAAGKPGPATGGEQVPAAPGKPEFTRVPGGKELVWNGVAIDVPKDWRTQPGEDGAQLLLPPGFGESGVLEEIYALCGDGSLRSLDAPDTLAKLQGALDEIQPGLAPQGEGVAARFGALRGKRYVFAGENPAGQKVEARLFAFPMQKGVGALLALGFPASLQARQRTVDAMLASLRGKAGAAGADGAAPAELAGQWVFYASFNANNGGGSSRQKVLTLRPDGSYTYVAENVSTNPNGAAWGDQNDTGRWSADASSITFRSQGGESRSCTLEKRNHPKNRDPMLVIDGSAFVTATQRAPW